MQALGIDIGGSGIKAAVVDTATGQLASERRRLPTPAVATPAAVCRVIRRLVEGFDLAGPVGVGFPGVIRGGTVLTAVNLHPRWVGLNLRERLAEDLGRPVTVLNDADAAGWGEVQFGAARSQRGTVMVVTVGTGIGTAIFHDGRLLPNTELGHIEFHGRDAEKLLSEPARKRQGLSWAKWSTRFGSYLVALENLFWPELFVLGGGGAKKKGKILPHLHLRTPVVAAELGNQAGIIGAAWAAMSPFAASVAAAAGPHHHAGAPPPKHRTRKPGPARAQT